MLPQWDPRRLETKIPFNLALCGGRRMGKSSAVSSLLEIMKNKFDLIIAFIGSASCNPVLKEQMFQNWDDRFFFSQWEQGLIDALLKQQETLKLNGITRNVLILMDDVVLSSDADEQLAHMAMRGRHFNISLAMCSVSYTSLPKRARRSLDCLLVFSLPMQSDMKILTWEETQKARMARFALSHLKDFECLVLETLQKKQMLFVWRADFVALRDLRQSNTQNPELQARDLLKKPGESETPEAHPHSPRPSGNVSVRGRIQSWESRTTSKPASGGTEVCRRAAKSGSDAPSRL